MGLGLRGRMPLAMQQILTQGLGLFTLFLGVTMAGAMRNASIGAIDGTILGLLSIVFGGLMGEALQIEARLTQLGDWIKHRVKGGGKFTEGFVATSLLFCIGPMAILGCLDNGLKGDPGILTVKAVMDGLASIAFSSTYGIGVAFSSLMILLYQGSLSLIASSLSQSLPNPSSNPAITLISGVGGLMVIGIGCNLLELVVIRVSSFLPALLIAPLIVAIAKHLQP